MDSNKMKTTRSKSLNPSRFSVRRKVSFSKVRQQFENIAKSQVNANVSVRANSLDQTKTRLNDSVEKMSCERTNSRTTPNSLSVVRETLDTDWPKVSKRKRSLTNTSVIQSKILFFEEKLSNKSDSRRSSCDSRDPVIDEYKNCDKPSDNHRDTDIVRVGQALHHWLNPMEKSTDHNLIDSTNASLEADNIRSVDDNESKQSEHLCPKTPKIELTRTLSTASDTSVSSDILSSDAISDVTFRRPTPLEHTSSTLSKPIPKQRTSINKKWFDNEIQFTDPKILIDSEVQKPKEESNKIDNKRCSGISQDSGVSDLFQSQVNKTVTIVVEDVSANYDDDDQIYQDAESLYDDHIYEELRNCQSMSPDWIDIEQDDKHVLRVDRRSQILNTIHNNYRKSKIPIPCKRRSSKKDALVVKVLSSDCDDSATEYEDIDDSDDQMIDSASEVSRLFTKPNQKFLRINIGVDDQRVSAGNHIYEAMTDIPTISESPELDLKAKLVRELSTKLCIKDSDDRVASDLSTESRPQSHQNIYTETPIRRKISLKSKRNSIYSRNSSIYIAPNYGEPPALPSPRQVFQKQESVTASIASYLELNLGAEMSSPFKSEPLYQFYQKDVRRRAELWIHMEQNDSDFDYDEYENTIYGTRSGVNNKVTDSKDATIKNMLAKSNISAMDFVGTGPNRSLWCQLPQVIDSKDNLLKTLSDQEKRLQESLFEIITSEASYCKSLNILVSHFCNCIELSENSCQLLTQREKKCLFSNVIDISKVSANLLSELEKRFEQNILLYDVCDILYDYCVNHFQPYIHYCAYQRDQEKLLTELTQSRSAFVEVLQRLESNQICQSQTLLSFLMLPMQRITRYPLLIEAVCQQLPPDSPILESCRKALGAANQLVIKCNEETKKVQRMQELIEIEKILHFRSKMKSYPIVSGARFLVKRGSVLRLTAQLSPRKTIGKASTVKWTKLHIHLFLFSDLLILAKKKSENNYSVFDYCSRNTVQLVSLNVNGEDSESLNKLRITVPRSNPHLAQLILLNNHESKSIEYTIGFSLESEKLRWIEAMSQPSSENPNEVIYEEWDCPQVQCIKAYCAQQTDEISLEETDVLNVTRKIKDGWFEGQRIRDGLKGWFPSEFTEEIVNQHVRARNMKLRNRLLMYTQNVIQEQKKPKE